VSVLLDTNIVSEIIKPKSEPRVARWLMGQPAGDIFLCAVTEAELRYGLALMPTGRRRDVLAADVQRMLSGVFATRLGWLKCRQKPTINLLKHHTQYETLVGCLPSRMSKWPLN